MPREPPVTRATFPARPTVVYVILIILQVVSILSQLLTVSSIITCRHTPRRSPLTAASKSTAPRWQSPGGLRVRHRLSHSRATRESWRAGSAPPPVRPRIGPPHRAASPPSESARTRLRTAHCSCGSPPPRPGPMGRVRSSLYPKSTPPPGPPTPL